MQGNQLIRKGFSATPHCHTALQNFVMAMDDAENKRGKRSLFGKDLSIPAYEAAFEKFRLVIEAMHLDGIASADESAETLLQRVQELILFFAKAYPNWPAAYRFGDRFLFGEDLTLATEIISKFQRSLRRFDRPMITRSKNFY